MTILRNAPGFRWGNLIPGPGYGRCHRCHRPWWAVRERSVYYNSHSAQFALCVSCWDKSTVADRVAAHLFIVDQQENSAEKWVQVKCAVVRESTGEGCDILEPPGVIDSDEYRAEVERQLNPADPRHGWHTHRTWTDPVNEESA